MSFVAARLSSVSRASFDVAAAVSVLDRTDDPLRSRLEFLKAAIFNLCIGNTDNHAKNHALLYGPGGKPSLAPLYDLLPIRLNKTYTHDLAVAVAVEPRDYFPADGT